MERKQESLKKNNVENIMTRSTRINPPKDVQVVPLTPAAVAQPLRSRRFGGSVIVALLFSLCVVQVNLDCPATDATPSYLTRYEGRENSSIHQRTSSTPFVQVATSSAVEVWPLHLMRGGEGVLEGVHNYATHFSQ